MEKLDINVQGKDYEISMKNGEVSWKGRRIKSGVCGNVMPYQDKWLACGIDPMLEEMAMLSSTSVSVFYTTYIGLYATRKSAVKELVKWSIPRVYFHSNAPLHGYATVLELQRTSMYWNSFALVRDSETTATLVCLGLTAGQTLDSNMVPLAKGKIEAVNKLYEDTGLVEVASEKHRHISPNQILEVLSNYRREWPLFLEKYQKQHIKKGTSK